jgi:hypothetical protein
VKLPIPKAVERRLRPAVARGERFLKEWEWTWTSAFIAGIVISFLAIIFLAVVPSWWIYFASNKLGWTDPKRILVTIRDMLAMGYLTVVAAAFVVTGYLVQVIRKRLRGEKQAERYSGGYR